MKLMVGVSFERRNCLFCGDL